MIISLVLISIVLLSASSVFAAEDNNSTLSQTDEMTIEETINSVEVTDEVALAEEAAETIAVDSNANEEVISNSTESVDTNVTSNVVTKETFHNYFDENGVLLDNVTSDELIFNGSFSEIGVNYITVDKPIKFTGNDAVFTDVTFVIMSDDVTVDGFTLSQSLDLYLFDIEGRTNVTLSNNNINFVALEDYDGYAIYANAVSALNIINNTITYIGNTAGNSINNAVRIEGDENSEIISDFILVQGNTFDITIPSVDVNYDNWPEAITYSEGIVFYYCEYVEFSDNYINLNYNTITTKYGFDSIYVVSVKGNPYNWDAEDPIECYDVLIHNNTINAVGHSYIYGISVAADDVEISDNVLNITSEGAYANGITINGPSSGDVLANEITLAAEEVVYGIYSAQYDGAVMDMTYSENVIDVDSYFACGMELMENNPVVDYNVITATGNHTSGIIASISGEAQIIDNEIYSLGNNEGTDYTSDSLLPLNSVGISIKGKHVIKDNVIEASSIGIDLVEKGPSTITDNNISVIAIGLLENYGIYAFNYSDIRIANNNISFVGSADGKVVNNAIRIEGDEKKEHIASNIIINGNSFDIVLPSVDVDYSHYPETVTYSDGVLFYYCEDVEFCDNVIDVDYNGVFTSYGFDSIYVVSVKGNPYNWDAEDPIACYDVLIHNNTINAVGHSYIYGISVAADDVEISDNVLNITSEGAYANGITVNGPSNGDVIGNEITLAAEEVVYGIYSAQYDGAVMDMTYSGNIIDVDSYFACGMELMENNPVVEYNVITATGNHTFGIVASISGDAQINFNEIYCLGNNVGTMRTGDDLLPLNSIGISTKGRIALNVNDVSSTDMGVKTFETILIAYNNTIVVGGDYAVVLDEKSNGTVFFNYLVSEKGLGDYSVVGGNQVTVMANNPALNKVIMSAQNIEMVYGSNNKYAVCLLDTEGNPLANYSLEISIGEASYNVTTDETGYATLSLKSVDAGNYTVVASFAGNGIYAAKSFSSALTVTPKATNFVAAKTVNVLLTAIKKGYYYEITLKDTSGNVLANKKVKITFNGKTYTKTTDSKGLIKFKLASTTAGNKKLTMKFEGDNNYKATSKTATIKITKEATKLVASSAAFKVNTKTKVVKVTLKDSKNKGVGGVKITLRVNGVNYVAKTVSSGVANVKITKLNKVGSFGASIKFAGNNYYKAASKAIKITVKK